MSGRRLLQSLSRRRSSFQSIYVHTFNQSHKNWILLDRAGKGVLPNDFCPRVRGFHLCLPHQRFYSVCTDRITLFDEGSETCIHHQQDLHVASEDEVISKKEDTSIPRKSKRAKCVKKSGISEKEESCVARTTCSENKEGQSVVDSQYSRTFKPALENGSPQSIVRNLIGNENHANKADWSKTCIHHQQDLHVASEDQVISKKEDASSPCKSKRAKRVKKSGISEKEESCVVRTICSENQEEQSVVESEYSGAFKPALENGSPQSIVRNLIGNENHADKADWSKTCIHHQQDLHVASADQVISKKEDASSPRKSKIAKRVKKSGISEKEENCVARTTCSENQEGQSVVESKYSRTFKPALENGSPQSIVRDLIGNANEAAHSTLLDLDNVTSSLEKTFSEKDVNENDQEWNHADKADAEKECHQKILDLSDVEQVFQVLLISKQSGLQKHERDSLAQVFKHFREAGWASEQALRRCHISKVVFPLAVSRFRKFFFSRRTPEITMHLLKLGPSADGDQFLFPLFSEFANREFPGEIARYKALVETSDLTKPHTWFPFARAMKRKVVYHLGPTNSGKTYNALERFKKASSGLYCGPLRLLAMEVYDSVNSAGVYCSLITGQERKEVPFANHVACTVEMVSLQKPWEVAIIDEIQMLADEYRGWAWTRAFLGVQANELHVCGDPSALSLVSHLCAVTGDELEEHSYERFEPLSIDERSLEGKYSNIKPGDCIVSFSRKDIFSIKRAVELFTGNRCCVIYGALPPETRTHQAKLFNDPTSGYDVLVATDAVGMGLNLNIRRVIFHTLDKYNGDVVTKVSASQVKQIAGRAGRRGTLYQIGVATTFFFSDIPHLVQCMQEPFVEAHGAGLFPGSDQIELFASKLPEATFTKLLDSFAETCRIEGSFFLCRNDNLKKVASVIDKVQGLTLEDKMSFILAPVNSRDSKVVGALLSFALAYSKRLPVHLAMVTPTGSARSVLQLMDLEARHQVLSLYLWLSQHFPEEYFPQKEQAEQMATDIAFTLGESLAQTNISTAQTGQQHSIDKKMRSNQRPSQSQPRRGRH